MALSDFLGDAFTQIFGEASRTITHRTVVKSRDSNDNLIKTPTDTSISAVVQRINEEDIENAPGVLKAGDMWIFTQPSVAVDADTFWIIDSVEWKTAMHHVEEVNGVNLYNEVVARRIQQ